MTEYPTLEDKVAFLSRREAYPHRPDSVTSRETHMSWVFLAGPLVYKLKKPVIYRYLDFTTLAARQFNCLEEVRLNARLANGVYLGVIPLYATDDGALSFEPTGPAVEWLVCMRRLPDDRMLDALIEAAAITPSDIRPAADKLATFYANSLPLDVEPEWAIARFMAEHDEDSRLLSDKRFNLDRDLTLTVLDTMRASYGRMMPYLELRSEQKAYLEGHGDLRPEHVCLLAQPVFIDCLEFNRDLRILDPFDEIAYLGLECERLGARWIGEVFLAAARDKLAVSPPEPLLCFYRAARALLRARLAIAHLTEPNPRTPKKWEPRARQYIQLAGEALSDLEEQLSTLPRP